MIKALQRQKGVYHVTKQALTACEGKTKSGQILTVLR